MTNYLKGAIIKVQKDKERRTYLVLYKYIIAGCECWLSEKTGNRILAVFEEIAEERRCWENLQKALKIAEETDDPMDWQIYSDLHKDYWGVRPHW